MNQPRSAQRGPGTVPLQTFEKEVGERRLEERGEGKERKGGRKEERKEGKGKERRPSFFVRSVCHPGEQRPVRALMSGAVKSVGGITGAAFSE